MSWSTPPRALSNPHRTRIFDHQNGVQYDEIEVVGSDTRSLSWIAEYRRAPRSRNTKRGLNAFGTRSLMKTACLQIAEHWESLTPEHFRHIPWAIAQRVWQQIIELRKESFYVWRVFVLAYPTDFSGKDHRYFLQIKAPSLSIPDDFRALTSFALRWLTCLRISPKQLSAADLVSVSSITNLAVLDLSDGQHYIESRESTFDARVLRSWSELARDHRAFQHLRVLMLGWQEKLDAWIFQGLSSFPRLEFLLITDCKHVHHKNHKAWDEEASRYGWSFYPAKRGVKHLKTVFDDGSDAICAVSNLLYDRGHVEHATDTSKQPETPLLECTYGNPREWSHIIDEFPGTRTVFLYRAELTIPPAREAARNTAQRETNKRDCTSPVLPVGSKRMPPMHDGRKKSKHTLSSLLADFSQH